MTAAIAVNQLVSQHVAHLLIALLPEAHLQQVLPHVAHRLIVLPLVAHLLHLVGVKWLLRLVEHRSIAAPLRSDASSLACDAVLANGAAPLRSLAAHSPFAARNPNLAARNRFVARNLHRNPHAVLNLHRNPFAVHLRLDLAWFAGNHANVSAFAFFAVPTAELAATSLHPLNRRLQSLPLENGGDFFWTGSSSSQSTCRAFCHRLL